MLEADVISSLVKRIKPHVAKRTNDTIQKLFDPWWSEFLQHGNLTNAMIAFGSFGLRRIGLENGERLVETWFIGFIPHIGIH